MGSRDHFVQQALNRSNQHRANHGVGALRLNRDLCVLSQGWAEVIGAKSTMQHNKNARYRGEKTGENIAYSYNSASNPTGGDMIDQWYNEIEDYNFNRQGFKPGTGHFTQLVWKDSTEVGFGLSVRNGHHFLVANYYPAGNFLGEFDKNVFPPGRKSGASDFSGVDSSTSGGNSSSSNFPGYGGDKSSENFRRNDFKEKKSPFSGFFSKFGRKTGEAALFNETGFVDRHSPNHLAGESDYGGSGGVGLRDFNEFHKSGRDTNNNNFLKSFNNNDNYDNNNNDNNTSTTTTVETKVKDGMKITTTTTVKKSPQGTTTQTNTRKEWIGEN